MPAVARDAIVEVCSRTHGHGRTELRFRKRRLENGTMYHLAEMYRNFGRARKLPAALGYCFICHLVPGQGARRAC